MSQPKFPKTQLQRMIIVQEIESKLIDERIESELGSLVLMRILNKYLMTGQRFINKEVKLLIKGDQPRKFIINLYNDAHKRDQVLIRFINTNEK